MSILTKKLTVFCEVFVNVVTVFPSSGRRMDLPPTRALASRPLREHDGLICYPISFLQVFYFASILCLHGSNFRLFNSCCSESLTSSSNSDLCVDF